MALARRSPASAFRGIAGVSLILMTLLSRTAPCQVVSTLAHGQSFQGEVLGEDDHHEFLVEAVADSRITIKVTGSKGFHPDVAALEPASLTELAHDTGGKSVKLLVDVSADGAYLVRISGADDATGSFIGRVLVNPPKTSKKIVLKPNLSSPGQPIQFNAAKGSRLSGSVTLSEGTPTGAIFFTLRGPSGDIDLLDGEVVLKKKGKVAKLLKIALPHTGEYTLTPTTLADAIAAKLKLLKPLAIKGKLTIEPLPSFVQLPTPDISLHPQVVGSALWMFEGNAPGAAQVKIIAPTGQFMVDADAAGSFVADVPLAANKTNAVSFVALPASEFILPSAPATTHITVDAQGPSVAIQSPASGAEVTGATTVVTGLVGDTLSGFDGLAVTVNGKPAVVAPGIGSSGTFMIEGVPLTIGPNTLTVEAIDGLNNTQVLTSTVHRVVTPAGVPYLEFVSGDLQTGPAGSQLPQPVLVRLHKADGSPLPGKVVTFAVTRNDGRIAAVPDVVPDARLLPITTNGDGEARVWWTLGTTAGSGNNRLRASSIDVAGTAEACATSTPLAAGRIVVNVNGSQSAQIGTPLPLPLVARVVDGVNPIPSIQVTFEVVAGGGLVNGKKKVTVVTSSVGLASVSWTMGGSVGAQRVEARYAGQADGTPAVFHAVASQSADPLGTTFSGIVLDNASRGIGGATCTLAVNGESLDPVPTDALGRFTFVDIPAGPAELGIDASTADLLDGDAIPQGSFPSLHFENMVIVPGAANSMGRPIFQPRLDPANVRAYSTLSDTVLEVAGVPGLRMIVSPGSMTLATGEAAVDGTPMSLNRVYSDEIPMPLPDGSVSPFAWTLQPAGVHFDPPVVVEIPNMTGRAPGTLVNLSTFDHATGRFEIVGTGSVSDDGSLIRSDPGAGLTIAGWGTPVPPPPPSGEVVVVHEPPPEECSTATAVWAALLMTGAGDFMSTVNLPCFLQEAYDHDHLYHWLSNAGTPITHGPGSQAATDIQQHSHFHKIQANLKKRLAASVVNALIDDKTSTTAAPLELDIPPFDFEKGYIVGPSFSKPCTYDRLVFGFGTMEHRVPPMPSGILTPSHVRVDAITIGPIDGTYSATAHYRFADWYSFGGYGDAATSPWPDWYGYYLEVVCGDAVPFSVFTTFDVTLSGTIPLPAAPVTAPALLAGIPAPGPDHLLSPHNASAAQAAMLSEIGEPTSGGGWSFASVPAGPFPVRPSIVLVNPDHGQIPWYYVTDFVQVGDGTKSILTASLPSIDPPPSPVALSTGTPEFTILQVGDSTSLAVVATLSDGSIIDAPAFADGTGYVSSNASIVTVDTEGVVTAIAPGVAFVTVANQGLTITRKIEVFDMLASTTVTGLVQFEDGSAADGAIVTSSLGGSTTTSAGAFTFDVGVPSDIVSLSLEATALVDGIAMIATKTVQPVFVGGTTDAGILVLTPAASCAPGWTGAFGAEPGFNGEVRDFAYFDDGNGPAMYAAGSFSLADTHAVSAVARWDGHNWLPLGEGMNGAVLALAVHDDGSGEKLYAGGSFTTAGGMPATRVARWDGDTWSDVGGGMDDIVWTLAVHDDGSGAALYAGGAFLAAGGGSAAHVARWDGTSWSALAAGTDDHVYTLASHDAGSGAALFAGGAFDHAGGVPCAYVARWDGSNWGALGNGMNLFVNDLESHDDGSGPKLYAGGFFTKADSNPANHVARWDGSSWSPVGAGWEGTVWDMLSHDDGSGPVLYAGGLSLKAGTLQIDNVGRWDGSSWSALDVGTDGVVHALGTNSSGGGTDLFVGGGFSKAGGLVATRVARWDGASWHVLGHGLGPDVTDLAVAEAGTPLGPAVYASGSFQYADGQSVHGVAKWDGSSWTDLDGGIVGAVVTLLLDETTPSPSLFAGGYIFEAGGLPISNIARWDGSQWSPLATGTDSTVWDLALYDDGGGSDLYAAGDFSMASGVPASHIARWSGTNWSSVGSGTDASVLALVAHDDGSGDALYLGGAFYDAGGTPVSSIARWDGTGFTDVGGGVNGSVLALATYDDGSGGGTQLFAGGEFTVAGGNPASRIARWDGMSWASLGQGLSGTVLALEVHDDGGGGGPALYAGGDFLMAGGTSATRIARWDGNRWTPVTTGLDDRVWTLASATVIDGSPSLFVGGSFETAGGVPSSSIAEWGCVESTASFATLSQSPRAAARGALTAPRRARSLHLRRGEALVLGDETREITVLEVESGATVRLDHRDARLVVDTIIFSPGARLEWLAGTIEVREAWWHSDTLTVGDLGPSALVLSEGATLTAPSVHVRNAGILIAHGVLDGNLHSDGLVLPFPSDASFAVTGGWDFLVTGSYRQGAAGALIVGAADPETSHVRMVVADDAQLDGVVGVVARLEGSPALGFIEVLRSGHVTGAWSTLGSLGFGDAPALLRTRLPVKPTSMLVRASDADAPSGTFQPVDLIVRHAESIALDRDDPLGTAKSIRDVLDQLH